MSDIEDSAKILRTLADAPGIFGVNLWTVLRNAADYIDRLTAELAENKALGVTLAIVDAELVEAEMERDAALARAEAAEKKLAEAETKLRRLEGMIGLIDRAIFPPSVPEGSGKRDMDDVVKEYLGDGEQETT